MADEAYRAVFLRVHPTGKMVLSLNGKQAPAEFDLVVGDDGRVTGSAKVAQTAFGMKPYSALFGALKVADEVVVTVEANLQSR